MNLAVIGVNYNNTPIDIREKVSFSRSQKEKAGKYLIDKGIKEVVILSTCNRSEIYIISEKLDKDIDTVKKFYKEFFSIENIEEYLFTKNHKDALFHVYYVAAGLDSMILCEDQILGQVKEALDFSIKHKLSGKVLNKLFKEAVTSAKRIKTDLKVSETPISMVYIAIKILKEKLGSLKGKKACIIGIGEIGRLALTHLLEEDLCEIYIANRTYNNILDLLSKFHNVKPIQFEKRYEVIENVDIVITATSAPHTILDFNHMKEIHNNLYIMDLALPRDVEKKVATLENITLCDVDDFKNISEENMKKREELSKIAKDIINSKVEEFIDWSKGIKVDSVIKNLNERCSEIKDEYFQYIDKKLELDEKSKKVIDKMLSSALTKLVKDPILNLKGLKDEEKINEYINVVNDIFNF